MSNPCYHQAAGGLNTAQMVLGCITISNKSGSIYKDEPASTFWFTPSQQANHNWIPFIWAKPRIRVIINLGGSYWPAPSFPDPTRNSVGYVWYFLLLKYLTTSRASPILSYPLVNLAVEQPKIGIARVIPPTSAVFISSVGVVNYLILKLWGIKTRIIYWLGKPRSMGATTLSIIM